MADNSIIRKQRFVLGAPTPLATPTGTDIAADNITATNITTTNLAATNISISGSTTTSTVIIDATTLPGVDAGAKISFGISSLPSSGGIIDARGFQGAQNISSSVIIPTDVQVWLGPIVFTAQSTVTTAVFQLVGHNAKLLGFGPGSNSLAASAQVGTIIRSNGLANSVDMVAANVGVSGFLDGLEIGWLCLDHNNTNPAVAGGRNGLFLQCVSNSWIHDIQIFHSFQHGVAVYAGSAHSYDVVYDRVRVHSVNGSGFYFSTETGTADLDRHHLNTCTYIGYNAGDQVTRYGQNGFILFIPAAGTVTNSITDMIFHNCFTGGTVNGGSGFNLSNASATANLANIVFRGELEDPFQANTGTGFNISNGSPSRVFGLDVIFLAANYTLGHNVSPTTAAAYTIRQTISIAATNTVLLQTDGIQLGNRATVTGGSQNSIRFSNSSDQISIGSPSDGRLVLRRDDSNLDLIDVWNPAFNSFGPSATGGANLGNASHYWGTSYTNGLHVATGVNADSGLQHARFASGTTAAAVGATVATVFTWTHAFADANYTVTAAVTPITGAPQILSLTTTNAQVSVVILATTAVAAQGTIHVIAMHD